MDIETVRAILADKCFHTPESLMQQCKYTYNEIFHMNAYGFDPPDVQGRGVLDLGANIGFFSILAACCDARHIIALEPNASNFDILRQNVYQFKNVSPILMAAHDGKYDRCRSYGDGGTAKVAFDGSLDVETRSLDQLTEMMPYGDQNVLKMDVEGSEFDILPQAKASTLRKYKIVFMEIHGEGHAGRSLNFMKHYMGLMGYEVAFTFPVHWITYGPDGQMVDCKKLDIEVVKFNRVK